MALSKVDVESGGTGLIAAGASGNVLTSDGTNWTSVEGGGGPSLANDSIIRTTVLTITENATFAGTENGMSAGPVAIGTGSTVTVTSPSVWTII